MTVGVMHLGHKNSRVMANQNLSLFLKQVKDAGNRSGTRISARLARALHNDYKEAIKECIKATGKANVSYSFNGKPAQFGTFRIRLVYL